MATLNTGLLEHPIAMNLPATQQQWVDFLKVLVQFTANPDSIDVAIDVAAGEGIAFSFTEVPINRSEVKRNNTVTNARIDVSDALIESLQIAEVMNVYA